MVEISTRSRLRGISGPPPAAPRSCLPLSVAAPRCSCWCCFWFCFPQDSYGKKQFGLPASGFGPRLVLPADSLLCCAVSVRLLGLSASRPFSWQTSHFIQCFFFCFCRCGVDTPLALALQFYNDSRHRAAKVFQTGPGAKQSRAESRSHHLPNGLCWVLQPDIGDHNFNGNHTHTHWGEKGKEGVFFLPLTYSFTFFLAP